MIKVSILYPYRENVRFDVEYYCNRHMTLAAKRFEPALKGWSVDKAISAGEPNSAPSFVAAGHFLFDSVDIPNYTDSEPQILISEVVVNV
jgi:uncharacterized protein (TIGR02118 family)